MVLPGLYPYRLVGSLSASIFQPHLKWALEEHAFLRASTTLEIASGWAQKLFLISKTFIKAVMISLTV